MQGLLSYELTLMPNKFIELKKRGYMYRKKENKSVLCRHVPGAKYFGCRFLPACSEYNLSLHVALVVLGSFHDLQSRTGYIVPKGC